MVAPRGFHSRALASRMGVRLAILVYLSERGFFATGLTV